MNTVIVRVVRIANGELGFEDVTFPHDLRAKGTEGLEDLFKKNYQEKFPKHEIIDPVIVLGNETSYDTSEDFKELLAKKLGLMRDYKCESVVETTLAAAASFVNQGYVEGDPLRDISWNAVARNGRPMLCRWCGKLHWTKDHQEEIDKPENAAYVVVDRKLNVIDGNHRIKALQ